MQNDPRTASLIEWNQLARENTENAIVSSMFEAASKATEPLDRFSTWLLVGTAAIASFLIANSDKVIPLLSGRGFGLCGALLCVSCAFGLFSKFVCLHAQIGKGTSDAIRATFAEHLARHKNEEKKITQGAAFWGVSIQTGIRIDRVLSEFYKPLPRWVAWLAKRQLKKHEGNPQIGYLLLISSLKWQGYFAAGQAATFLAFLVVGFVFAATKQLSTP